MNDVNNIAVDRSRLAWSLPRVVFVVASLILLAGFLIPFPGKVLDVLWVCSFCLAGAIALICVVTRNSSDLVGFVPMISGLLLLCLVVQTGTARRIIQDEPAGILLSSVGSALASTWPLGAVLICLAMAAIIVVVIFTACQKITLTSTGYLERVLPLKRMGIEADLRQGVIDDDQARAMAGRVVSEGRFFAGMNGAALLMRAEAAVCIFILLACLLIPALNDSVSWPSGGIAFLTGIAPPVVALSVFALVPALIVAVSCGALMSKDTLALQAGSPHESASAQNPKIKVVSLETEDAADTELLNPDFTAPRESNEQVVEFEPALDDSRPVPADISCRDAKEYYEKLAEMIGAVDAHPRVVLLAADQVQSLPVTVAVNMAIHLAQKNQKVLLVDTDAQRNAVAHVFDLDPQTLGKKIQPSCLENLSVGCVPWEKLAAFLQKNEILAQFDTALIYTPTLPTATADPEGLAASLGAFYFVDDKDSAAGQKAAEKLAFCGWFRLIPSLQSALNRKP